MSNVDTFEDDSLPVMLSKGEFVVNPSSFSLISMASLQCVQLELPIEWKKDDED